MVIPNLPLVETMNTQSTKATEKETASLAKRRPPIWSKGTKNCPMQLPNLASCEGCQTQIRFRWAGRIGPEKTRPILGSADRYHDHVRVTSPGPKALGRPGVPATPSSTSSVWGVRPVPPT